LADGHLDLHSARSSINLAKLASIARDLGADKNLASQIENCNTSLEALGLCTQHKIDLAQAICERALNFAQTTVPKHVQLEIFAVNRQGKLLASAIGVAP
jgi:cobalt-precorrin-5B (C1)-methyltransferase